MTTKTKDSRRPQISKRSPAWERAGVERLYKIVGSRKVSFVYKHLDGRTETLRSAPLGDRPAIHDARLLAMSRALEIGQGRVIADSVGEMIDRFRTEFDRTHFRDQSKDGITNRKASYDKLKMFFGKMAPATLKTLHGYQYLDARAKVGAPARANKEMALMSTVCHQGVRWGLIERNPFTDMVLNVTEINVRTVMRREVLRFYLWSIRQRQNFRTLGCAAMFTYLTGFRAAEVRPFLRSGITPEGVMVIGAKRKRGQPSVLKLREWSPRLRCVVARALDRQDKVASVYLFAPTRKTACYSRSGWGSSWQDAMNAWIRSRDATVKATDLVTDHALYFALQDVRPAAVTTKFEQRSADVYDFAAHANRSTTDRNYDRRRVRRASATE